MHLRRRNQDREKGQMTDSKSDLSAMSLMDLCRAKAVEMGI